MKYTFTLLIAALLFLILCLLQNTTPAGVFKNDVEKRNTAVQDVQDMWP